MNAIQQLDKFGQSIWFDNISRKLISSGKLKEMVGEGLQGVTSNPTIFDKAIAGTSDYDDQIRELTDAHPDMATADILRELMISDIKTAADVLRPVYDHTNGRDGYISIEVNPHSAHDTRATEEEVRYFWNRITRPNLMVKIPATKEGLPAIEQMTSEGININVTLIFSQERYCEVVDAYLRGIEARLTNGNRVNQVTSVASVFVSRVDTLVDSLLEKKIQEATDSKTGDELRKLLGTAAVANAKLIYQSFKEIFGTPRFVSLQKRGARIQRPLWGSTGTKNPAYSELKYVENLVGAQTVNTVPPQTYAAMLDHLTPTLTIESDLDTAKALLQELSKHGIDLGWVMQKLEDDGVAAFEKSFDDLLGSLAGKQVTLLHA